MACSICSVSWGRVRNGATKVIKVNGAISVLIGTEPIFNSSYLTVAFISISMIGMKC